jgi:hypothetical protein
MATHPRHHPVDATMVSSLPLLVVAGPMPFARPTIRQSGLAVFAGSPHVTLCNISKMSKYDFFV